MHIFYNKERHYWGSFLDFLLKKYLLILNLPKWKFKKSCIHKLINYTEVLISVLNCKLTPLVYCLYQMSPLNHKKPTSSLEPSLFCVAKNYAPKRWKILH